MKDFIQFIADIAKNKKLRDEFLKLLGQKNLAAKKLENWFISKGYTDISLADCEAIIKNKKKILDASNQYSPKY
jgi:hypothetical protein